jgi:hypothetical protein
MIKTNKLMTNFIQTTKKIINILLVNFTLAKFTGALVTITIVALIKYMISGNLHIDYCEFGNNVAIGLLGWTINTAAISWLSEYLGLKGINFNLNQFLYGYDKMGGCDSSSSTDFKPKLYNAMESNDGHDPSQQTAEGNSIDKGKGIDIGNTGSNEDSAAKPLDKGKGIDKRLHPIELGPGHCTEPPFVTWSRVFPGLDPASVFFPKTINPGPGFNVPGGEVPLRDEICKHIDYNSHILKQFKQMDLKTALEQRDNYLRYIQVINEKTSFAQETLSKVPEIPTSNYEHRLKNTILKDLHELNEQKIRAEAKTILLNSRIEFIQINIKPE